MKLVQFKLLTIICEPVISSQILTLSEEFGATGSTVTEVKGQGSGEKRSGEIPDLKMKIEIKRKMRIENLKSKIEMKTSIKKFSLFLIRFPYSLSFIPYSHSLFPFSFFPKLQRFHFR